MLPIPWTQVIGIPNPNWGATIGNPVTYPRPTPPSPWTSNVPKFFYVEAGGTNSGNGYPGNARSTMPAYWESVPGMVVFVNGVITGDYYSAPIRYAGTATEPCFILSYNPASPATFGGSIALSGGGFDSRYLIIDGINLYGVTGAGGGSIVIAGLVSYFCARNCIFSGPGDETSTDGSAGYNQSVVQFNNPAAIGDIQHIVIAGCLITKGGNWMYAVGDPDAHGVSLGTGFRDIWILDNEISYMSGCAVQVGAGTTGATPNSYVAQRIYIGRNIAHHTAQSALWTKRVDHCIFSCNVAHTMRRDCPSSPNSCGFGGQYGPRNTWFIFNTVYNCQSGIVVASSSLDAGIEDTEVRMIGNVCYNIKDELAPFENDCRSNGNSTNGVCIASWSQVAVVVNNTMHNYNGGVLCPSIFLNMHLYGNIFSGREPTLGADINIFDGSALNTIAYNLFSSMYALNDGVLHTSASSLNASKGPGNLSGTPVFENVNTGDFRLKAGSPGIDTGGSAFHPVYDLFESMYGISIKVDRSGGTRPFNTLMDNGAFEFGSSIAPPPPPAPTYDADNHITPSIPV